MDRLAKRTGAAVGGQRLAVNTGGDTVVLAPGAIYQLTCGVAVEVAAATPTPTPTAPAATPAIVVPPGFTG